MKLVEAHNSRSVEYGAQGGRLTWRGTLWHSDDEVEVYEYVAENTELVLAGFIRQNIRPEPVGGGVWAVEVEYGTFGLGGGDQPVGAVPIPPEAPASDDTPLTSGFAIQVEPHSFKLTQSLKTTAYKRIDMLFAPDYRGAIQVDKDGRVEGCEVPPRASATWTRTVFRPWLGFGYYRTLIDCAGKTNKFEWYGFGPGNLLYMGADGQYTQGEGWSITHKFGVEPTRNNIVIVPAIAEGGQPILKVDTKRGFDYLWVLYGDMKQNSPGGSTILGVEPIAAYVEKVLEEADFTLIGIGG